MPIEYEDKTGVFNNIIPATFQDSLTYLEQLRLIRDKINEIIEEVNKITEGGGSGYILEPATSEKLGGIKVGENLTITEDGTLNAQASGTEYRLPISSKEVLGGVKQGDNTGIQVNGEGVISLTKQIPDPYQLPISSKTQLGGVKQGDNTNIQVDSEGVISLTKQIPDPYELPEASTTQRGGIVLGKGLDINGEGKTFVNIGQGLAFTVSEGEEKISVDINENKGLNFDNQGLGLKLGTNLSFGDNGEINASGGDYQLPISSKTQLGGVILGDDVESTPQGVINIRKASGSQYGIVLIGNGLYINNEGKLTLNLGQGLRFDASGAIALDTGSIQTTGIQESKETLITKESTQSNSEIIQASDNFSYKITK